MKSKEWYDEIIARRRAMRETLIFGKAIEKALTPPKKIPNLVGKGQGELPEMITFPMKHGMTLRRFRYSNRFTCSRCDLLKQSKFNAISLTGIICNPCYGKALTLASR
jgi:hypothetical protein